MSMVKDCLAWGLALLALAGCGKKKTMDDLTTEERTPYHLTVDKKSGIIRMDSMTTRGTATLQGIKYTYTISRKPDNSLPAITDEDGNQYIDNVVRLDIQSNGRPFFSRSFMKKNFETMIDTSFVKNGILEGMAFDEVKKDRIVFSISVSYPQADMNQSLSVEITPDGGMHLMKEETLDGSDPDPKEAE